MGRASMRPGRNAPDNETPKGIPGFDDAASMRPGRNAPDNQRKPERMRGDMAGFNEAGAKCPG